MTKKLNIDGLIAAPFTPMHPDGAINLKDIEAYANYLKSNEVAGVFICGTTGEGMLMDVKERIAMADEWIKSQSENFKIIVHVGSTSYVDAIKLAAHAQSIGADAIGTMGPVFLPPNDVVSLVDYCEPIAKAASKLPFYYYHIPSISKVEVNMKDFLFTAKNRIPNLAGIKFTHNNLMEMQQSIAVSDKQFEILHGYDEVLLAGLALGATGAVGSTYNYMASCYNEIITKFRNGHLNKARELQQYSVKVVEILIKYGGGVRAGKEIMSLSGIDCGSCRAPIKKFTDKEKINLQKDLASIGFFRTIKSFEKSEK